MLARYEKIGMYLEEENFHSHYGYIAGTEVVDIRVHITVCPVCGQFRERFWVKGKRPINNTDGDLPLVVEVKLYESPGRAFWWELPQEAEEKELGIFQLHYHEKRRGNVVFYFPPGESPLLIRADRYVDQKIFISQPHLLLRWEHDNSGSLSGNAEVFPEIKEFGDIEEKTHIGCSVWKRIKGIDPSYQHGRMQLYILRWKDLKGIEGVPFSDGLFGHQWEKDYSPPDNPLVRKVGDLGRCGLAILSSYGDHEIKSNGLEPLKIVIPEGHGVLCVHPV